MKAEDLHSFAVRVRRAIAGDLDAAARYEQLGRPEDAEASRAIAERWNEDLAFRLRGNRPRQEPHENR